MKNSFNKFIKYSIEVLESFDSKSVVDIRDMSPMISISFDDFPVTAAQKGAAILKKYNVRATYFISLGKVGQDSNVGVISDLDLIKKLIDDGHEIGNHTYDHTNMNHSSINIFEESILKNNKEFKKFFSPSSFETFSYPYGVGTRDTIRIAKKYFRCARTTNKGINLNRINLFMLRANPVYGNGDDLDAIKKLINLTIKKNGWLNLYTHDVTDSPSEFGCTPGYFERVIEYSAGSGARIATLNEVCDLLGLPAGGTALSAFK